MSEHISGSSSGVNTKIFGSWQVERILGEGAMGRVYLAHRKGEIKQRAALKVSKHVSEVASSRFRKECRILAGLNHPHIAHYLDGGTLEDGRHWLALEYVNGVPIDRYCKQNQLTINERIRLFIKVCEGLSCAHQALVLHKDLKPCNILVDKAGTPHILDFGIASLLDPDTETQETMTTYGMHAMTPQYASPEQARGELLGAASDVYTMGVILYELLTGTRPYEIQGNSPHQIVQSICESKPPTLSNAIKSGVQKTLLLRNMGRDLNTVVQKTLRKEISLRYNSLESLAEDLRRYLDGHPVLAVPPTRMYVLRRFIGRHKLGVGLGSALIVLLMAFVSYTIYAERRADRISKQALAEKEISEQVTDFMIDLFESANVAQSSTKMTVEDLLDEGSRKIKTSNQSDPIIQARLQLAMGQAHLSLSNFDKARALYQDALTMIPEEGALRAKLLRSLAHLETNMGNYDSSEDIFRDAMTMSRQYGDAEDIIGVYLGLSFLHLRQRKLEKAEQVIRAGLEYQKQYAPDSQEIEGDFKDFLAYALSERGKIDEALEVNREALALHQISLGIDHPSTLNTANSLATTLNMAGEFDEALLIYKKTLASRQKIYGDKHIMIHQTLSNLASTYYGMGRLEDCYNTFSKAYEVAGYTYKETHPTMLQCRFNMGVILSEMGRFDQALALAQQGYRLCKEKIGDSVHTGYFLISIAELQMARGNYVEAEQAAREANMVHRRVLDANDPAISSTMDTFAKVLMGAGQYTEARKIISEVVAIRRSKYDRPTPPLASSIQKLGTLELILGNLEEAKPLLEEALKIRREFNGDSHWKVCDSLTMMARYFFIAEDYHQAFRLVNQSLEILEGLDQKQDIRMVQASILRGRILDYSDRDEEAKIQLTSALELAETVLPEKHPLVQEAALALAQFELNSNQASMALPRIEKVIANFKEKLPNEHRNVIFAEASLAKALSANGKTKDARKLLVRIRPSIQQYLHHPDGKEAERLWAALSP